MMNGSLPKIVCQHSLGERELFCELSVAKIQSRLNRQARLNNDQNIGPCGPKPAGQNLEHSISRPEARARMFPFEYAQLLTQGDDLEAEMLMGTEEGAEKGEESSNK